jgi:hypothetical protein
MSDEEKNMSFQEFVQHVELRGEARGEAIGFAIGTAKARARLLARAAAELPADRVEQLRGIYEPELLADAIEEALREHLG